MIYTQANSLRHLISSQTTLLENVTQEISKLSEREISIESRIKALETQNLEIEEELVEYRNSLIKPEEYRVAVFIVNYNMPEKSDALFEHLKKFEKWPIDIYLIDNGSDIKKPSKYTNVFIKKNIQTCRGWLRGLDEARKSGKKYFAYMFIITSTSFEGVSPIITPMIKLLIRRPNAVGVHPALTENSTTAWKHLITRQMQRPRKTWMIDNIASLYRADWFDSIGWFDKELIYAWGIDLETCYLARKGGKIFILMKVSVSRKFLRLPI